MGSAGAALPAGIRGTVPLTSAGVDGRLSAEFWGGAVVVRRGVSGGWGGDTDNTTAQLRYGTHLDQRRRHHVGPPAAAPSMRSAVLSTSTAPSRQWHWPSCRRRGGAAKVSTASTAQSGRWTSAPHHLEEPRPSVRTPRCVRASALTSSLPCVPRSLILTLT